MEIVTDELELRKPNDTVKLWEVNNISKLFPSMAELMIEKEGVGLSSCQVGIHKNFFIAQIHNRIKLFINPKIVNYSEETEIGEEGCLSFPGIYRNIERSKQITVQYFDFKTRKIVKETYSGLAARIIQHEYDHLNTKVCVLDNITKIK